MKQLRDIVSKLRHQYGEPETAPTSDPFGLVLLENIAYLADDSRRKAAFVALRTRVGIRPVDIAAASMSELTEIARIGGILEDLRATRLKECAQIALNDFGGDLSTTLKLPLPKAIKALKEFPAFGDPGAEKILLLTRSYPVLPMDSNSLRVCLRLGFGEEKKSYTASYKSVRASLTEEIDDDFDFLISAHNLLRHHGKELCKRTNPKCDQCPLTTVCAYYNRRSSA